MDTVRAFVGCLLDLTATRRVVDLARAVRRASDAAGWKAAWVPPPNLHVTLRFLGDIDAGLVPALSDGLANIARQHAPLRFTVSGLVAFPSRESPRVVCADITQGHEALGALARAVDDLLFDLGIPREKRPFHGHVTLARVKHAPTALSGLGLPNADCGPATVNEITLWRSDLQRAGAEYHALWRHPLGAQPTPKPIPTATESPTKQATPATPGQDTSSSER
jgi:2'-5' RNA ligase